MMAFDLTYILFTGILIMVGFTFGQLANLVNLPKATGYLIAGLVLHPNLFNFFGKIDVLEFSRLPLNISLSIITFAIGGGLSFRKLKKMGRSIISIGVSQAELTLLVVLFGFLLVFSLYAPHHFQWGGEAIPLAIILGALALPTDPAAFLAVKHELKAEGEVTSTTLGIAAIDDLLTFLNFVLAVSIAGIYLGANDEGVGSELLGALLNIAISIGIGLLSGLLLNLITRAVRREVEGVLIVMTVGMVLSCYGLAEALEMEALLATMTMGLVVVNFNSLSEEIFGLLDRYTEELVFVIFFTLSGMRLNFGIIGEAWLLILLFIVLRFAGKWIGAYAGAFIGRSNPKVRRLVTWGLLPQGGIVIGLALVLQHEPGFESLSDLVLGVVIVATIFYEILGPITTKYAITKAGEDHLKE